MHEKKLTSLLIEITDGIVKSNLLGLHGAKSTPQNSFSSTTGIAIRMEKRQHILFPEIKKKKFGQQ